MPKNTKLYKIFNKEKKGVLSLLNKLDLINLSSFLKLCDQAQKTIKNKKKIIFFGNGGSASDAQHLATELTVRYKINRKAISAISLATDTSALTAIGNDFGFKYIFSRQLETNFMIEEDMQVTIIHHGKHISVKMDGVALENGQYGDWINVKNTTSGRIILAKVVAEKKVTI